MVRNIGILTAVLVLAATLAVADDVVPIKGPSYSNARITGFQDGVVLLDVNGNVIKKSLDEIRKITVTSQDSFNEAEGFMAKSKFADAVKSYDQAMDRVGDVDWLKQLTAVRRLKALGQAGMIDRAVTEWLALLDQTRNGKFVLALQPAKMAAKGAKENDDAIAALEAKEGDIEKDNPVASGVRQLLLELYTAQGQAAKARAMAAKMGGSTKPPEGQNPDNTTKPPVKGGSLQDVLKAAEYNVTHGGAELALKSLKDSLQRFTPAELPKALLLMGKAQLGMAKSAKDDGKVKELRVAGGLNLMRVVTFYPTLPEAAEASYLAGVVNLDLGNRAAARAAFNRVLTNYKGSPFAADAAKAIDELEKSSPAPKAPAATGKDKPKKEPEGGDASPE